MGGREGPGAPLRLLQRHRARLAAVGGRLRATVERAIVAIPRLVDRVVSPPLRIAAPEWRADPTFEVDYHIRRIAIPEPGSMRDFLDVAQITTAPPLDRSRPLWEFTLVEGLEGGRAALLQRLHHTITDGVGGMRLSLSLVDLEREPAPAIEDAVRAVAGDVGDGAPRRPRRRPRRPRLAARRDPRGDRRPRRADRRPHPAVRGRGVPTSPPSRASCRHGCASAGELLALAAPPGARHRPRALRDVRGALARPPLRHARRRPRSAPPGRQGARREPERRLRHRRRRARSAAFHREFGERPETLRMAMPVSTRDPRRLRRQPVRAEPRRGPRRDRRRRRAPASRCTTTLQGIRHEPALDAADLLAALTAGVPTSVLVSLLRAQTRTIDFATSNLRGSPVDLYLGGARIEASYPMGPRAGVPVNVTMMSYCGELHLGIHSDPAAVVDPDLFLDCLRTAFADLAARRPRPDGPSRRRASRASTGAGDAAAAESGPAAGRARRRDRVEPLLVARVAPVPVQAPGAAVDHVEVQRRRVVGELEDLARAGVGRAVGEQVGERDDRDHPAPAVGTGRRGRLLELVGEGEQRARPRSRRGRPPDPRRRRCSDRPSIPLAPAAGRDLRPRPERRTAASWGVAHGRTYRRSSTVASTVAGCGPSSLPGTARSCVEDRPVPEPGPGRGARPGARRRHQPGRPDPAPGLLPRATGRPRRHPRHGVRRRRRAPRPRRHGAGARDARCSASSAAARRPSTWSSPRRTARRCPTGSTS